MAGSSLMILCDTNILIEFYKAKPSVIQTLQHIGSANIAVSVITKAELFYWKKRAPMQWNYQPMHQHLKLIFLAVQVFGKTGTSIRNPYALRRNYSDPFN